MAVEDDPYVYRVEDKEFEGEVLDLGRFAQALKYPISREEILEEARAKNIPDEIIQHLKALDDVIYHNAVQVIEQIGSREF